MENFKIDAIEPHIFINCISKYDDFEEKIFALTWGKLFRSMQTDIDVFNKPLKEICNGLSFTEGDKEPYIEFKHSDLSKMGFLWVYEKFSSITRKTLRISTSKDSPIIDLYLFSAIENKNPYIRCYFSPVSLRYLLYFGESVGGCFFSVAASIHMGTAVRQRLYRLIRSNLNKKSFVLGVNTLKNNYNVPDYDYFFIKKRILDPFVKILMENPHDKISISYQPIYDQKYKIGRPKVEAIKFIINHENQ